MADERDQELEKILMSGDIYANGKGIALYDGNYSEYFKAIKRLTVADFNKTGFTMPDAKQGFRGMK